jgi:DNA-binding protein H-NS
LYLTFQNAMKQQNINLEELETYKLGSEQENKRPPPPPPGKS